MADGKEDGGDMDQVEEEFTVWKKNTPILYDLIISHPLEWPSLTVHWVPSSPHPHADPSFSVHKLVLGTHTCDGSPNFLMLADALLPSAALVPDTAGSVIPKIEITRKIVVDGEVNRARCMPQKPSIVAAKTSGVDVCVFDCAMQLENQEAGGFEPDLRLKGHDKEGFGLSWNPCKEGYLLSSSHDRKICLWDVAADAQAKVLDAVHIYEAHEGVVEGVSWNAKNENIFGSAGDDCRLMIWDLRTNQALQSVKAHDSEVNFLSFNPHNEWILATASSDSTVGLLDVRKLAVPLHILSSHQDEVYQVEWDPNHETVLASSSADRRVMVWDLNRIGDEQLEGDCEDGPPELLFSHGGHKAKISDFSWNKNHPWTISSVAEDNAVQIWQMSESIYYEDDEEDVLVVDNEN